MTSVVAAREAAGSNAAAPRAECKQVPARYVILH
jgi:hypothetical protein